MPIAAMIASCSQPEQKSGIRLENFDTSVRPADDFYQFACGGWMKNNPLPGEFSRYGSFEMVDEITRQQVNDLITGLTSQPQKKGSVAHKIAMLYNQVMDSTKLNADGIKPIESDLNTIRGIKDKDELLATMVKFMHKGIPGYFNYGTETDIKDSKNYIVSIVQGGLTLNEREYYTDTDENTLNIMKAFKAYVQKMFEIVGYDTATAAQKMEDVLKIETRLAKVSKFHAELRDPEANYNKISYATLQDTYKNIDFDVFCNEMGFINLEYLNLGQPDFMAELNTLIADESVEAQKSFLEWAYIDASASYLADEVRSEQFNFYGKVLSGRLQEQPRWKRAVGICNNNLGEAIGQIYVEKYFPAPHKERMVKLVQNLQTALRERIQAQDWMTESTKSAAIDKLSTFRVKIGYPDKWRSYEHLEIMPDKSLWENMMTINTNEFDYMVEKHYNKPVDLDEWFMTPQTINAYNNPTSNEICFPAGILQYPFFDMEADDAFNYGAIGVVIGHEMTHGFDDEGRKFDKDGNMHEWWAQGDAEKFDAHVTPLVEFFNNIEVLDGLKANGKLTLGENLADHGGLQVAYQAFLNATKDAPLPVKDGFTPQQRFFLAYANVWANNIRDEEIRVRTKSDVHSLGRWRVNGTLPHIKAWYEAFDVKESDKMFVPENERVNIW